ncbi:MAG TPA: acetate/propionate family kinase [Parafilimonas sp.]|nr:acetate/propionate family kinase [Parafilimonas sp.]
MNNDGVSILTINAGSSSIKFALYEKNDELQQILSGKMERIGLKDASFTIKQNDKKLNENIDVSNFRNATTSLINWFEKQHWFNAVKAIGHRVVHGMQHTKAEIISDELLNELNKISNYDPDHLPAEIDIIQTLQKKYPQLIQVACFDTAFHTTIPSVAKTFAIPKKYSDEGIRRYGFHGISYSYLLQQLIKENAEEAKGKIILAHLGNGASIAAVKDGKCIDTSMGFTPAAGIVMSTRSGDLDPGIAWYLMQQGMDAKAFNNLINHQSGLLGISGASSDMQDLLQQEKTNTDAALAVDIFCYQIAKYIGAYIAALNGLDALVFSGGIGENASVIRARICDAFQYINLSIDQQKNNNNELVISNNQSKIKVYVIPTNEELMIAEITAELYSYQQ